MVYDHLPDVIFNHGPLLTLLLKALRAFFHLRPLSMPCFPSSYLFAPCLLVSCLVGHALSFRSQLKYFLREGSLWSKFYNLLFFLITHCVFSLMAQIPFCNYIFMCFILFMSMSSCAQLGERSCLLCLPLYTHGLILGTEVGI